MQRSLILLKPDAVEGKFCGKVIARFEESGFKIIACKMMHLTPEVLRDHYAHIAEKPFYPEVETFMHSAPVIALVLEGDDVISKVRDMLGATDSKAAAPGTIRAELGSKAENSKMINVAHASDSEEAAAAEIARFFKPEEVLAY